MLPGDHAPDDPSASFPSEAGAEAANRRRFSVTRFNPGKPSARRWVLERLAWNVERAMQGEAVVLRGKATGEYRYDGAVANRALELLGKELGLFTERGEKIGRAHV